MRTAAATLLAIACTASAAHAQRPVAVAHTRFDLNADGRPDEIRLDNSGVSVSISGDKNAGAWMALATTGRVVGGQITAARGPETAGNAIILVVAELGSARNPTNRRKEAIALKWSPLTLTELWRGPVGALGLDSRSRTTIELGKSGLILYSERPDVYRCDREPARLYASRFDFAGGRFRPAGSPPRVPASAPVLTAKAMRDSAPMAGAQLFSAQGVSSSLVARGADDLVPPQELTDGSAKTGWIEGKGGIGRGEFATLTTRIAGFEVRGVRIVPRLEGAIGQQYNRPRRLGLLVGERAFWVELTSDPAATAHRVVLPEPIAAQCVSLILDDVYPRSAAQRNTGATAIAEVVVETTASDDPAQLAELLCERIADGGPEARAAARLVTTLGDAGVAALEQRIAATTGNARAVNRLRLALADIPAAPTQIALGLVSGSGTTADRHRYAEALIKLGESSAQPLSHLAADDAVDAEGRLRAIETLARIGGEKAQSALIELTGRGPRPQRRAVALALSTRPVDELDRLVEAANQPDADVGRRADLWRAVGLMARRAPPSESRSRAGRALAEQLTGASGYELRHRLLVAAASVDEEQPQTAAESALATLASASGPEAIALKRVTLTALARVGNPRAIAALVAALSDTDPGVRNSAINGLSDASSADASADAALGTIVARDRWPALRRGAAGALGMRCRRAEPARALRAAIGDTEVDVAVTALVALASCSPGDLPDILLEIVRGPELAAELRTRAASLLADVMDARLEPIVVQLFADERRRAFARASSVRVAAALAASLGAASSQPALQALFDAARDGAFPVVQAAAVQALSQTCPPKAVPLFRDLARTGQRQAALAARRAQARCR